MRSFEFFDYKKFVLVTVILLILTSLAQAKIIVNSLENSFNFYGDKFGFSHAQIKLFEKDLRKKTGLQSLKFNEEGELDYDFWENSKVGSLKLREAITGAIDDERNIFKIISYSNSKNIHFARANEGEIDVNTRITTYRLKFDLADFLSAERFSDEEAFDSFTLAIVLFHEIDHKVSYDLHNPIPQFQIRPEVSHGNVLGVRENTNYVRSELNLIVRDTKEVLNGRYKRKLFRIPFLNRNGKYKFLRWENKGK